jgi:hypothetical protein
MRLEIGKFGGRSGPSWCLVFAQLAGAFGFLSWPGQADWLSRCVLRLLWTYWRTVSDILVDDQVANYKRSDDFHGD